MEYKEMTERQLRAEHAKAAGEYQRIMDKCLKEGQSYDEFMHRAAEAKEKLYLVDKYLRLKAAATVEYGKEWKGDLMSMDEFTRKSKDGLLDDESGDGYYATDNAKSDVRIMPSDVIEGLVRTDFSHVMWFEKDKEAENGL